MRRHRARRTVAALTAATLILACAGSPAHPESGCRSEQEALKARCYAVEQTPAVTRLIEGARVHVPQVGAATRRTQPQSTLVVTIDSDGNYHLNYGRSQGPAIRPQALAARVAAVLGQLPGLTVLVRGHEETAYGDLIPLIKLLHNAGAMNASW